MQSANRWQANVLRTTISVSEFAFEIRSQGHTGIILKISEHDGMADVVEDLVDAVMKLPGGVKTAAVAAEKIIANLATSNFSIGDIAGKLLTKFPRLVTELVADGVVLQPGETVDDFLDWLDSLTLAEVTSLVLQWYDFNFEGGVRPLFEEARDIFQARKPKQADAAPAKAAVKIPGRPLR